MLTADGELHVASRGLDIKLQVLLSVLVNPENKTPKHRLNNVVYALCVEARANNHAANVQPS